MGITLHAIVEIVVGPGPDEWDTVSSWEFNKLPDLSIWLYENVAWDYRSNGWPKGSPSNCDDRHEFHDEGRQWCGLKALEKASAALKVEEDYEAWFTIRLDALIASLRSFRDQGTEARVLWYRA
jgi:hypothetical protein